MPLRISVLDLLIAIDTTVRGWAPDEKGGTVDRLHALAGMAWRPQDASMIDDHVAQLQRWTLAATELLIPPVRVFLPQPCPRCGTGHVYHRGGSGESVRSRALLVTEDGAECLGCGSVWPPSEYHFLARLLGCEPVPAA